MTGQEINHKVNKVVADRKAAGLWTECDELGHDLEEPTEDNINDLLCSRCNVDFISLVDVLTSEELKIINTLPVFGELSG